jgi:ATP-dependent exoDNAse (exonuclease V) beta subunit
MHRLQARVNRSELLRLLYVGCTRARESLTLAMTLKRGKDGGWQAAGDSFADLLAPLLGADIPPQQTGRAAREPASTGVPPRSPRLPAGYRFVADDPAYRPPERRTLRPSEAALDAQEIKPYEGDLYVRLVGTMYHEAMRRIAHEGLVAWQGGGESRRRAMAAGLRHLGLPEPRIAEAVDRVLALLRRTLSSEAGRWLLAPRAWAQAEYALAGYRDGQWVSAIVDRCFEEDGVIWMIDYKTTSEPPAQALERHRDQLQHYAGLLSALRGKPVRSALFLAESGELVIADRPAPAKMFL